MIMIIYNIIFNACVTILVAVFFYKQGEKDGHKNGYRKGFNLGRMEGIAIANMTATEVECPKKPTTKKKKK